MSVVLPFDARKRSAKPQPKAADAGGPTLWCRIGLHAYGRWEFHKNVEVFATPVCKRPAEIHAVYFRECRCCAQVSFRRVQK